MAPLTLNSTIKLPSGHEIPRLGFGVRQTVCQVATARLANNVWPRRFTRRNKTLVKTQDPG